jgi:hypothetical protein
MTISSTDRLARLGKQLRPVPYPPRAAELERQIERDRQAWTAELHAAEASGAVRGWWQRLKFRRRLGRDPAIRELSQMQSLPFLWLVVFSNPFWASHVTRHFLLVPVLVLIVKILDPFLVWIGSRLVPHGGFTRWQFVGVMFASLGVSMVIVVWIMLLLSR